MDASTTKSRVVATPLQLNARDLERELDWFVRVVDTRMSLYFGGDSEYTNVYEVAPPDLKDSESNYARVVLHYNFQFVERMVLILSLVSVIRPRLLDVFFTKNESFGRKFTEFGGVQTGSFGDFEPTGETLAFILGGNDLETLFNVRDLLLRKEHVFMRHAMLDMMKSQVDSDAIMKVPLRLTQEYLCVFTTGTAHRPDLSVDFPARYINTALGWDDLVLHPGTRKQIQEIEVWIEHGDTLLNDWAMLDKLRPGYRALFYGPPGTGKTMTACMLGKSTGHDVYKVDLSLVVSKYIGETEKNLAKVFDQAQHKGWILFFDEADALFGSRTKTNSSNDRYANQEVSFLLQRIESFDGIAILASNFKDNLDEAFLRRFESIIYFPVPGVEQRLEIWQQGFSAKTTLAADVDIPKIAEQYVLTGGAIMNTIRFASLQALQGNTNVISLEDIQQGIRRELTKEGKSV